MRDVAAVTGSSFTVGAVHPAVVFGGHHVTVDTGLRVVTHVRYNLGFFGNKEGQADHASKDDYGIGQPS